MIIVLQYLKYIFTAKGRHGIHSPFVYAFVTNCIPTKIEKKFLIARKKLFKNLKNNSTTLEINDFGSGSKKLGKSRTISSIFRTSSSKGKFSLLLYRIAHYYKPKNTLEFGTSLGIGSIHLSKGNEQGVITTVEACENTRFYAKNNLKKMEINNVESILSTFENFIDIYKGEKFDLVFIDGHHDGIALLQYLEKLKPLTHNDTLIILDDIRWSSSMLGSWKTIINDPFYHVSIDLFRMGIITPRSQQTKEHFTIRF